MMCEVTLKASAAPRAPPTSAHSGRGGITRQPPAVVLDATRNSPVVHAGKRQRRREADWLDDLRVEGTPLPFAPGESLLCCMQRSVLTPLSAPQLRCVWPTILLRCVGRGVGD